MSTFILLPRLDPFPLCWETEAFKEAQYPQVNISSEGYNLVCAGREGWGRGGARCLEAAFPGGGCNAPFPVSCASMLFLLNEWGIGPLGKFLQMHVVSTCAGRALSRIRVYAGRRPSHFQEVRNRCLGATKHRASAFVFGSHRTSLSSGLKSNAYGPPDEVGEEHVRYV